MSAKAPKEAKKAKVARRATAPRGSIALRTACWLTLGGIAGLLLTLYFAWVPTKMELFSREWFSTVDGDGWFNATRSAITGLGALGIGGAAYIAYRRQHSNEAERDDAVERDLHARFTEAAKQLGDEQPSVRLAGVYSLTALADDWHAFGRDSQRQAIVNVLTAYLRTNTLPDEPPRPTGYPGIKAEFAETPKRQAELQRYRKARVAELEVRKSIVGQISKHLPLVRATDHQPVWWGVTIDLQGARLANADFSQARLQNVDLSRSHLDQVDFTQSDMTMVKFNYSTLNRCVFLGSTLTNSDFYESTLNTVTFMQTKFISASNRLIAADFVGARLTNCDFTLAQFDNVSFARAVVTNPQHLDTATATGTTRLPQTAPVDGTADGGDADTAGGDADTADGDADTADGDADTADGDAGTADTPDGDADTPDGDADGEVLQNELGPEDDSRGGAAN